MRVLGFYWGILGVIGILLFAIIRLSAKVIEMGTYSLSLMHWMLMLVFACYMAYAEGYKGFHLNFSPRVVARANYIRTSPDSSTLNIFIVLFAPLFCMGYIYSSPKRKLISFLVTFAIICVVVLVGFAPQPWRGIVDVGVVLGLGLGIVSILSFWLQIEKGTWSHSIPLDLPESF